MPYTINGVGTWYYGRNRVHTLRSTCEFCGAYAELSSYDTTNYFVFLFIPLVPLGKYRILRDCPHCRKHRVMSLKQWEKSKQDSIAAVYEKLRQKLDDPEAVQHVIGVAVGYQDEGLLLRVAERLAGAMRGNADVQGALGSAYAYFSRWVEAEQAFRASLQVKEDAEIRRFLAVEVMRQGRAEEAEGILRPILEERKPEHVGLIMLLVEVYQSQGNHQRSLELLDSCEQLNAALTSDKSWIKFRKSVEKHARSGRAVQSATLAQSTTVGYSEGGGGSRIARWIGPAIAAVALLAYFIVAFRQGQQRQVFLVNGTKKPYTVTVNGHDVDLPALAHRKIELAEGDVQLASREAQLDLAGSPVHVATSFWLRPFLNRTFVINPDRVAMVTWEEVGYGSGAANVPVREFELHVGDVLYQFSGVDYPFQPFPQKIKVESGTGVVKKSRVATLSPGDYGSQDLILLALGQLGQQKGLDYLKGRLQFEPDDEILLAVLFRLMDRAAYIDMLEKRLAERPVLVGWHRVYQHTIETSKPEHDLVADYRKLLADNPNDGDLMYLLGRIVDDPDEAEDLFTRSIAGNPASVYGHHGLASMRLGVGEFEPALSHIQDALRLIPDNEAFLQTQRETWLATKRYDDLLNHLRQHQRGNGYWFPYVLHEVQVLALKGDRAGAEQRITRYVTEQRAANLVDADSQKRVEMEQARLRADVAYASDDVPAYIEAQKKALDGQPNFELSFTAGNLEEAAETIRHVTVDPDAWTQHLLLYLSYQSAGNTEAAERSLGTAIELLRNGTLEERTLATALAPAGSSEPLRLTRLALRPNDKRIMLAALGTRYPADRDTYFDLARRLCYDSGFPRLFLLRFLEAGSANENQ